MTALAATSLAVASLLAACGGGGSSSSSGSGKDTLILNDPKAQLAAANKEGEVDWYTALTADDVAPLVKAFNKEYPHIKVKSLRLGSSDITPRLLTEQQSGKFSADVVYDSAVETSHLIAANALQKYDPTDQAPLPAGLNLPKGYTGVAAAATNPLVYDPAALKKAGIAPPTSFEDFTKPEWKGHFAIKGSSPELYDCMVQTMGRAKALAMFKAYGANKAVLTDNTQSAIQSIQSGATYGSVSIYGHDAQETVDASGSKNFAYTNTSPLPVILYLLDMVRNAPDPNAAAVFINWFTSTPGQKAVVAATGHQSLLGTSAGNNPKVWNDSAPKTYCRPIISNATFNQDLKELQSALHVPN